MKPFSRTYNSATTSPSRCRKDEAVVLSEMGDNFDRLDDMGEARIAAINAQGIDMQIISLLRVPGSFLWRTRSYLAARRTTSIVTTRPSAQGHRS